MSWKALLGRGKYRWFSGPAPDQWLKNGWMDGKLRSQSPSLFQPKQHHHWHRFFHVTFLKLPHAERPLTLHLFAVIHTNTACEMVRSHRVKCWNRRISMNSHHPYIRAKLLTNFCWRNLLLDWPHKHGHANSSQEDPKSQVIMGAVGEQHSPQHPQGCILL